jgi:hypothetical protein
MAILRPSPFPFIPPILFLNYPFPLSARKNLFSFVLWLAVGNATPLGQQSVGVDPGRRWARAQEAQSAKHAWPHSRRATVTCGQSRRVGRRDRGAQAIVVVGVDQIGIDQVFQCAAFLWRDGGADACLGMSIETRRVVACGVAEQDVQAPFKFGKRQGGAYLGT